MELLVGAVIALLTEVYKWIVGKLGVEKGHVVIYVGVFILCLAWALFKQYNVVKPETYLVIGQVFAAALAFYEVVIKWVVGNVFKKLG